MVFCGASILPAAVEMGNGFPAGGVFDLNSGLGATRGGRRTGLEALRRALFHFKRKEN
jgi:hypothetical protein